MDMKTIQAGSGSPTAPRGLRERCIMLRTMATRLHEIAVIEPTGDGTMLTDDPRFRRKMTDAAIALLALESTLARTTALDALLDAPALAIERQLAALTLEAVGPYAAVAGDHRRNARIGPVHGAGVFDAYLASHARAADHRDRPDA